MLVGVKKRKSRSGVRERCTAAANLLLYSMAISCIVFFVQKITVFGGQSGPQFIFISILNLTDLARYPY